jgi:solute carrier family 25 (mitochondrial iron transporter), member 28/37
MNILYREEGLFRFWKGAQVIASGCIPAHASYFTVYELLKRYFKYENQNFEIMQTAMIGALTTFAHDFFITPSDMIKQRLQLCSHLTATQVVKTIVKDEGIWALYRSYPVTVMMNIPFAMTVVCVNENLKTYIQPWNKTNSIFWYFICAGAAGGLAGLVTNPLDVIKTRLQTQELKPSCSKLRELFEISNDQKSAETANNKANFHECSKTAAGETCAGGECGFELKKVRYRDFLTTIRYIYTREGLSAFSKGVGPRMCINVPSTALSWGTYELIKNFLGAGGSSRRPE